MEIIGLSGYARSGKDTAADVLVEEFGFTRVAFADKLRDFLYALNPIVEQTHHLTASLDYDSKAVYVQDVVDAVGWDGYKETRFSTEIRRLLQRLGTEAGRQTMWDTIWIDAAFANLSDNAKVVVSDARFINEFEAVKERGGKIWRIERNGVGPANNHASEMEAVDYQGFDAWLDNNGTLEEFRDVVRSAFDWTLGEKANV